MTLAVLVPRVPRAVMTVHGRHASRAAGSPLGRRRRAVLFLPMADKGMRIDGPEGYAKWARNMTGALERLGFEAVILVSRPANT
jgi:hypothetical protein